MRQLLSFNRQVRGCFRLFGNEQKFNCELILFKLIFLKFTWFLKKVTSIWGGLILSVILWKRSISFYRAVFRAVCRVDYWPLADFPLTE